MFITIILKIDTLTLSSASQPSASHLSLPTPTHPFSLVCFRQKTYHTAIHPRETRLAPIPCMHASLRDSPLNSPIMPCFRASLSNQPKSPEVPNEVGSAGFPTSSFPLELLMEPSSLPPSICPPPEFNLPINRKANSSTNSLGSGTLDAVGPIGRLEPCTIERALRANTRGQGPLSIESFYQSRMNEGKKISQLRLRFGMEK